MTTDLGYFAPKKRHTAKYLSFLFAFEVNYLFSVYLLKGKISDVGRLESQTKMTVFIFS
jgi:hypothetical protein